MQDQKEMFMLGDFESEILEVIDSRDEFTRSDLQGVVQALVMKIFRKGKEVGQAK